MVIWSEEKAYKAKSLVYHEIGSITTNFLRSITLHKMKIQTRRLHRIKAHGCVHVISSRERIPTRQSRAEHDQRCPAHTLLRMRRWANTILTGITLRQYRSLLYELRKQWSSASHYYGCGAGQIRSSLVLLSVNTEACCTSCGSLLYEVLYEL